MSWTSGNGTCPRVPRKRPCNWIRDHKIRNANDTDVLIGVAQKKDSTGAQGVFQLSDEGDKSPRLRCNCVLLSYTDDACFDLSLSLRLLRLLRLLGRFSRRCRCSRRVFEFRLPSWSQRDGLGAQLVLEEFQLERVVECHGSRGSLCTLGARVWVRHFVGPQKALLATFHQFVKGETVLLHRFGATNHFEGLILGTLGAQVFANVKLPRRRGKMTAFAFMRTGRRVHFSATRFDLTGRSSHGARGCPGSVAAATGVGGGAGATALVSSTPAVVVIQLNFT
jgi:hypothetical protein